MPNNDIGDYITKSEAAVVYRRSERSLSRDITNAIKFRDEAVLANVELQLEDDSRRPGSELTIEQIVELRDRGLNPTWLIKTDWLQETYGRRDEPPPQQPLRRHDAAAEAAPPSPVLPEELPQRVAVLMVQNDALRQSNVDLRTQAERLEKELDRRAEERREENELQKQNNVLMQQIYDLLEKMQQSSGQINVLPAPRRSSDAMPAAIDAETVSVQERTKPAPKPRPVKSRKAARPRRPQHKRRKPAATGQTKPDSVVEKYLPSLGRAARFFSRK